MKLVLIIFDRAYQLALERIHPDDDEAESSSEPARVLTVGFSGPIAPPEEES